jgi:GTPase Era involved in 16S rRNA processing
LKRKTPSKKKRNFFHSYILGPPGSGRTQFLRNLVGLNTSVSSTAPLSNTVVNVVELRGETYYLAVSFLLSLSLVSLSPLSPLLLSFSFSLVHLLPFFQATEITDADISTLLTEKKASTMDALVFIFDSSDPNSVLNFKRLYKLVFDLNIDFPCIFLANKSDRQQNSSSVVNLKKLATELRIPDIKPVSLLSPETDAYKLVVETALNP